MLLQLFVFFPQKSDSIERLLLLEQDNSEPVELDPEYVKEMEKYLAFIDSDKPKKKKKAKKVGSETVGNCISRVCIFLAAFLNCLANFNLAYYYMATKKQK